MKKKKIIIGVAVAAAAIAAYYFYTKSKAPAGPTPEELEAARQEQARVDNINHLLQTAQKTVDAAMTQGKVQLTPEQQKVVSNSKVSSLLVFGADTRAKEAAAPVSGLGASAYLLN